MYEEARERLLTALVATLGDEPRWELIPNRSYGFYLYYDDRAASLADVRAVIDETLNFSVGVILEPRRPLSGPRPGLQG